MTDPDQNQDQNLASQAEPVDDEELADEPYTDEPKKFISIDTPGSVYYRK